MVYLNNLTCFLGASCYQFFIKLSDDAFVHKFDDYFTFDYTKKIAKRLTIENHS